MDHLPTTDRSAPIDAARAALRRHQPRSWWRAWLGRPTTCRDCGAAWECQTSRDAIGTVDRLDPPSMSANWCR